MRFHFSLLSCTGACQPRMCSASCIFACAVHHAYSHVSFMHFVCPWKSGPPLFSFTAFTQGKHHESHIRQIRFQKRRYLLASSLDDKCSIYELRTYSRMLSIIVRGSNYTNSTRTIGLSVKEHTSKHIENEWIDA